MDLESLYLDYNATSPLSQSVTNWLKSGEAIFGNPSSQHSSGKAARKAINETRALIHQTFGMDEKEASLIFHSGATEGVVTLAHSFSEWTRLTGKELLICYSKLDHPAVQALGEKYFGAHVKFFELKMDQNLSYVQSENLEALKDKKDNNPNLVILYHHLWVNNETGAVAQLSELDNLKSIPDLFVHVDAVQAVTKLENWNKLTHGDAWTFSGHKFGALKGVGFTLMKKNFKFHALLSGGGQQQGQRSGTENVMGIQSLALALADALKVDVKKTLALRNDLEKFLNEKLSGKGELISTRAQTRNSNTLYFYLKGLASDGALALFDVNGLMLSAGSACSSGAAKDSTLLIHLGLKNVAKNGLRISFNPSLKDSELAQIKAKFTAVISKL